MDWLAWIVLAALATATVVWIVRRFRAENRRLNGMTGYPEGQLPTPFFARQHPQQESSINGCAQAQDVAREHP